MKSLLAAICITLLSTATLAASPQDVIDQYDLVRDDYLASPGEMDNLQTGYVERLMEGLGGDWFPLSILDAGGGGVSPKTFESACQPPRPHLVQVRDQFSIAVSRSNPKFGGYSTVFTNRGGQYFGAYTEPNAYLMFLGLDTADEKYESPIRSALANINGVAVLRRPSWDIFVIELNTNAPLILGRCPD